MNYSIAITILFFMVVIGITMGNPDFISKTFMGYSDVKDDLTGNYAIDKQIVRNAGEINFTIMLFLAMGLSSLIMIVYKISRFVELKIKSFGIILKTKLGGYIR